MDDALPPGPTTSAKFDSGDFLPPGWIPAHLRLEVNEDLEPAEADELGRLITRVAEALGCTVKREAGSGDGGGGLMLTMGGMARRDGGQFRP